MESHCNIPTIKPHIAQCQSYFLTSMFHSFFTHKQKSCTPFSIHPSCNLPLSKLQLLFQVFLHSSCTCLKEQFKSKSKELNTHNANAIFLLWHPSSTPKQLQLLFYVKTKIITHTHTLHKKVSFELQSQCFISNPKSQLALFHFELHMVALEPILSCNTQNEKKLSTFLEHAIISPLSELTCSFHTPNKIKIKIHFSIYISCMFHSIQIEKSLLWTLLCVLLQIRSNAKTSSDFTTPQVQLSWLLMINLCTMPQIVTTN